MATIQMLPRILPELGEKVLGLTKEFLGTVLDRDSLREEGQAQQTKATERIEEVQRELKADARRAQAQAEEEDQKAHQGRSARRRGQSEMSKTGPEAAASSTMEKVKGGAKQAAGALVGNDDLREEGAAQQDKASTESEVAREEAKAEEARTKAGAAERRQRAASGR